MKTLSQRLLGKIAAITLVFSLCGIQAFAGSTGKLAGKITDAQSGEPLIGANVLIDGTNLGAATDANGEYYVLNVPPGLYSVTAQYIGYSKVKQQNVRILIDLTTNVKFAMKQETIAGSEVVITAERPVVQRDISGSENNIDIQEITDGRYANINNVVTSQVAVQSVSATEYRPEIRASNIEESLFIVDGVVQGDPLTNRPLYKINLDAIQDVKIQTGGFSAKYGNFRSGIINVVTKEGGEQFHGSANVQYSSPGLKHFGPMPFGHQSPLSQPFVDVWDSNGNWDPNAPSNSGVGTTPNGDNVSTFFEGWNGVAFDRLAPGDAHYGQPMEVYARWLWRHRSQDSIDKLKELQDMGLVQFAPGLDPDDLVYHETGVDPDYNMAFTLGGPVVGLNNAIPTTFFLTYDQTQSEYAYRAPERSYSDNEFRGKITSRIADNMKLNLRGYWSRQTGGEGGQGPGIDGRISFDPFTSPGAENKFWYPHCAVTGEQTRQTYGLDWTHTLSPSTFYELKISHHRTDYDMIRELRDTAPIPGTTGQLSGRYGAAYENGLPTSGTAAGVQQGRIGTEAEADARAAAGEEGWNNWRDWARLKIGDHWYDEGPVGYGPVNWRDITGEYRMESCNLRNSDTYSRSNEASFNIVSQINNHNQIEAGFQIRRDEINQVYEAIDPSVNSGSIIVSDAAEWTGAFYVQDKIEYEGFVANLGLRADWITTGDFPQLDLSVDENGNVITGGDTGPFSSFLLPGNTLGSDNEYNTFNVIPLQTESKVLFSPRLGISHPISDVAKMFFNYGHMYQWPSTFNRYRIRYDTRRGNQINLFGNPNVEPPRTIQYELGYEHNLFNKMSLRLTGYYKDINNEIFNADFYPLGLGGRSYDAAINGIFRDVRGLELNWELRRNVVPYISGWASVNYLVESGGRFGFDRFYEDPSQQPREVTSEVSNPDVRPLVKLNANLHTPKNFGFALGDFYLLGDINMNLLYNWKRGSQFTWNPAEIPLVEDNLRWKPYQRTDLRFTKNLFTRGSISSVFYVDVINVFNNKNITVPRRIEGATGGRPSAGNSAVRTDDDWAWDGHRWWNNQVRNYLESLGYTAANQSSDADGAFSNTDGSPGDNKGDLPGFTPWTFLEIRDVFFGIRFTF